MWKCPECRGAQGRLRIEGVLTTVVIDADGESAEPVGDLEWNGTAVAHCPCGFRGTAADCETEDDEDVSEMADEIDDMLGNIRQ